MWFTVGLLTFLSCILLKIFISLRRFRNLKKQSPKTLLCFPERCKFPLASSSSQSSPKCIPFKTDKIRKKKQSNCYYEHLNQEHHLEVKIHCLSYVFDTKNFMSSFINSSQCLSNSTC